ncbi:MAG TPA: topoisomerase DNA-binding C4 zinc finger domain-containing protein, partial [Roseiflexaceae bacterium]|nr:topoisomerase DNA-binding C4 zinc finger domain-containing protein [Roseiflexaceae bacterium]
LPIQHFTEPPPRYTEASLVKELERLGIGRPSTYAPTLATVVEREYVTVTDKKLLPTTLGGVVTDLLVEHFGSIVDYSFTSEMEQQLDDIAEGEKQWGPVLRAFYTPFERTLASARETMRNVKREEVLTDITCPKCNEGKLAIKFGRNGEFLACNRYPECDFTSNFQRNGEGEIVLEAASSAELSDIACNVCERPMVIKKSRFGPFLGCSGYPECKNTRRLGKDGKPVPLPIPTGVVCPKCHEGQLMQRRGKFGRPFFGCDRYPKCDYIVNDLNQVGEGLPAEAHGSAKSAAANGAPVKAPARGKAAAANAKPAATASKRKSTAAVNGKPAARAKTSTPSRSSNGAKTDRATRRSTKS